MKTFLINITLTAITLTAGNEMIAKHFNELISVKSQLYVLGDRLSDNGNLANIFTYDTWNIDKVKFQEPFIIIHLLMAMLLLVFYRKN